MHQPDMAAVHQPDMAARLAWATAPRLRGTRCKRRFRVLMPAASITAHQASLRESVTAHQGLLRVNSLRDFKAPAMGRGFWMALIGGDPAATSTASQKQPGISQPGGAGHHGDIASA